MNETIPPGVSRTPDWSMWRNMRTAAVYRAVALALDMNPDLVRPYPQNWMGGTAFVLPAHPNKAADFENRTAAECPNQQARMPSTG